MLYPSINLLRTKVDSKYTLVSLAAKRARDLIDGKPPLVEVKIDKPVTIATEEIAEDLITYKRNFEIDEIAEATVAADSFGTGHGTMEVSETEEHSEVEETEELPDAE